MDGYFWLAVLGLEIEVLTRGRLSSLAKADEIYVELLPSSNRIRAAVESKVFG